MTRQSYVDSRGTAAIRTPTEKQRPPRALPADVNPHAVRDEVSRRLRRAQLDIQAWIVTPPRSPHSHPPAAAPTSPNARLQQIVWPDTLHHPPWDSKFDDGLAAPEH
ncbi:hypothetical protein GCM10028775_47360 [Catellatospora paridis]